MTGMKKRVTVLLLMVGMVAIAISSLATANTININTATVEELTQLDRIGTKYAEKIVAYREANGPFKQPEDIMLVKGIGEKVWELNKDKISVGSETAAKTSP